MRVIFGGSWYLLWGLVKVGYRARRPAGRRDDRFGFRIARTPIQRMGR
jgi:hypothetical protein